MLRKDREIKSREDIAAIMEKCDSCSLALFDENFPYIIPMNFGFRIIEEQIFLYFHGAGKGKKLELLNRNNAAAFAMDCSHKLITGNRTCNTTMEYESVCGNGYITYVEDDKKAEALSVICGRYPNGRDFDCTSSDLKGVTILMLTVNEITGKRNIR